jgi:hypothetical protein
LAKKAVNFRYPSFNSERSKIKPLLVLFGILFGLLLLAKLISFLVALNTPLGINPSQKFSWDGRSSVNLVLVIKKDDAQTIQSVVNYNPLDQSINVLDISEQTYFELPKNYGSWKVGSIYKLGQEDNPPSGGKLMEQSIAKLIGLPIDGILVLKKTEGQNGEEVISKLRQNRLSIISLLSNSISDLTPLEAAHLLWTLSAVRSDKVASLDFLQSNVTDSKLLPDSSRVLGVNTVKLDLFIRKNMADPNILEESKSIAIFNATSHSNLTSQVARTLTNLGGNVITTANTTASQPHSLVTFTKDSLTAQRIVEIYAPNCLKSCQINDDKVNQSRAEINIILGEDYYHEWYEK